VIDADETASKKKAEVFGCNFPFKTLCFRLHVSYIDIFFVPVGFILYSSAVVVLFFGLHDAGRRRGRSFNTRSRRIYSERQLASPSKALLH
jgi:hypothetical protein